MTDTPIPAPDLDDLTWARQRLEDKAGSALINAGVHGVKLLRGAGYPDEVFHCAQDYRAITIVLEALRFAEDAAAALARPRVPEGREAQDARRLSEILATDYIELRDLTRGHARDGERVIDYWTRVQAEHARLRDFLDRVMITFRNYYHAAIPRSVVEDKMEEWATLRKDLAAALAEADAPTEPRADSHKET